MPWSAGRTAETTALDLFGRLPVEALTELDPHLVRQHAPRGHWVFREGAAAQSLVVVRSGLVRVLRKDPTGLSGAMVEVAQLGAGVLLGDVSAMAGGTRLGSVQVLEEAEIDEVPMVAIEALCQRQPELAATIERFSVERLSACFATANPALARLRSLANHAVFGAGLYGSALLLARLLPA
jgi:CRP-like cAMP-binding protein